MRTMQHANIYSKYIILFFYSPVIICISPEEKWYSQYGSSMDYNMGQLVLDLGHQGQDFLVRYVTKLYGLLKPSCLSVCS